MIRKIFVIGFKHAKISCVFGRHPTVFAKQNPVLVFFEKCFCSNWLPANFCNDRTELNIHIWQLSKQTVKRRKIIWQPAKMRRNKSCVRMFCKHAVLLGNQCVPRWQSFIIVAAVRMSCDFQPALILLIHCVPKTFRICGMNKHRNMKLAAFLPNCVQAWVIYANEMIILIFKIKAKVFVNPHAPACTSFSNSFTAFSVQSFSPKPTKEIFVNNFSRFEFVSAMC